MDEEECAKPPIGLMLVVRVPVKIGIVMHTHGNLTASYLWQPGEFARRMLGERPSPVPPTRELWPLPQQPFSISTLHVAYMQDDPLPRRAATLPTQPYSPTTVPIEQELPRPRVCTVGTNTDPPLSIITKLRNFFKKQEEVPVGLPPPGRLTAVPREVALDTKEEDNAAKRAFKGVKKAISGAKYRIAPGTETVESPKIVYNIPKPGDRMTTTFGARESRRWKLPSKSACSRRLRVFSAWCERRPRRPPRRQSHPPRLQVTQV
ncbi:unnamed protein product [Chilo suppressalis]|uniref:DUF4758 domain-containing protein n=1 Tax=Chilo suppressalis TaxID=168631 RepID=A0ABN8ARQ8_CHISP|nr:unnamed protein product [Chilo suppressalis]